MPLRKLLTLSFIFIVCFAARKTVGFPASQSEILLGTSKVEITPPVGTPLAGFGRRHGKPSQGTHDPLYVRALSLTRDNQTFVFVSTDLVLIDEKLRNRILEKLNNTSLLKEQLILVATHNHSGLGAIGGRLWERFIMGKFRKEIFENLTEKIADAIRQSLNQKMSVTPEYGEIDISQEIENRMDEKLKDRHFLKILRFKKASGEIAGTLLFMAAHPTLLPSSNFYFSADFPGVLTREIERKSPPGTVALFINGAAGDLRPHTTGEFKDRFDRSETYGLALARTAEKISFQPVSLDSPWEGKIEKVKLPPVKIRHGIFGVPSLIGGRVFPRTTYFQAVRMGSFLFLTFPGELAAETGRDIEKQAAVNGLQSLIIGYANDYVGYIIPERYYLDQNNYESQASFYGQKLDWFFQEQAARLTDSLLSEEEKLKINPPGILKFRESLPVLKLRGSAYHRGFEEGRLLKKEIRQAVKEIFVYFRSKLPVPLLNRLIINRLLGSGWKKMEPYVSYEEYEQMRGLAKGAGISFTQIKKLHALPEVYPTWCSNGAYWGKATKDGRMIALRNLDWNREIGIHHYAAIKFHEIAGRQSYVNIGYYGFTGVLSGINEKGISVGQIGAKSEDETMRGVPMPFLLKRVLEESGSLEDAEGIFERSDRTRGYNYVIADASAKQAISIESTRNHLAIFQDQDPKESGVSYSLSISNAVFRADPALDPAIRDLQWASHGNPKRPGLEIPEGSAFEIRYRKQGELIQKYYGQIDPEIAKSIAREIAPPSNIQSVIYAFPDFWVANAKDGVPAAKTKYFHFNFDELKKRGSNANQ